MQYTRNIKIFTVFVFINNFLIIFQYTKPTQNGYLALLSFNNWQNKFKNIHKKNYFVKFKHSETLSEADNEKL